MKVYLDECHWTLLIINLHWFWLWLGTVKQYLSRRMWEFMRYTDYTSDQKAAGVLITKNSTWWRHQMETFSALLALCVGNSPVPVNSPHKDQWRGALMFSLICVWINGWVNDREAGDLRRHRGHYDVNVMWRRHCMKAVPILHARCKVNVSSGLEIPIVAWW